MTLLLKNELLEIKTALNKPNDHFLKWESKKLYEVHQGFLADPESVLEINFNNFIKNSLNLTLNIRRFFEQEQKLYLKLVQTNSILRYKDLIPAYQLNYYSNMLKKLDIYEKQNLKILLNYKTNVSVSRNETTKISLKDVNYSVVLYHKWNVIFSKFDDFLECYNWTLTLEVVRERALDKDEIESYDFFHHEKHICNSLQSYVLFLGIRGKNKYPGLKKIIKNYSYSNNKLVSHFL
jgi:hypothetical protein